MGLGQRPGRRPLRLAVLCLALLGIGAGPATAAISPQDFLASPAAAAFRTGDMAAAIAGFQALLEADADDVLVLRYLGMALDRAGRSDEAIPLFERAAALEPGNPAVHLFLGAALWHARRPEAAVGPLRRAAELAPESIYATRARDFLAAIERQDAAFEMPGAPRTWDARALGGAQFDSNVSAAAAGDEVMDLRFIEVFDAGYDFLDSDGLRFRGEGFAYLSQHISEHDFDAQVFEPALELSYTTQILGLPAAVSMRYAFTATFLDADPFSQGHQVRTSLRARPHRQALTEVYHRIAFDAFSDDGFEDSITSRDGLENAVGATQYLFCCGDQHYLFFGYEYRTVSAEGDNFDVNGHKATLGASISLPLDFRFDASGEYAIDDYHNFQSTMDRTTHRRAVSAGLSRDFIEGLSASLTYSFTDEVSNFGLLSYQRHLIGGTVAYRF